MELITTILNIAVPLVSVPLMILLLPPFWFFNFIGFIVRSVRSENLVGKVVLITGASSGIGEYVAYEYAKKGSCLALVARREDRLGAVAHKARQLGSPDVLVIKADVSKVDDCKRFVDETMDHFGRLDHLVNNAGIVAVCMFEDYEDPSNHASVMNTNFWGSVYSTHFALPHLRKSKGKIIVVASSGGWLPAPKITIYCATKAALISFYESLRTELGSEISIIIVTPGFVESEITQTEYLQSIGSTFMPLESTEACAKAILKSCRRGDKHLTEPAWVKTTFLLKLLLPQLLEWLLRLLITRREALESNPNSKRTMELRKREKHL